MIFESQIVYVCKVMSYIFSTQYVTLKAKVKNHFLLHNQKMYLPVENIFFPLKCFD